MPRTLSLAELKIKLDKISTLENMIGVPHVGNNNRIIDWLTDEEEEELNRLRNETVIMGTKKPKPKPPKKPKPGWRSY